MSGDQSAIERILERDRFVVLSALCLIIAGSWTYIFVGAGMGMSASEMSSLSLALGPSSSLPMSGADMVMGTGAMATPMSWTWGYAVLMFFMWWIMMIAMMLPSAAPMILLHAKVTRKGAASGNGVLLSTLAFTFGYLAAWALFSLVAVSLQRAFEGVGVLSPMMLNSTSLAFAGLILVFAGLYQMTPLKHACLKHCRSPIEFLSRHWKPGSMGALKMGFHHGAYCLGCCWGLMALLFFGGIMNLYWIIGLAFIVLLEKTAPKGRWLGFALGAVFVVWGIGFLARALA